MHDYTTIIGVIELRLHKINYANVQKRYRIGRSRISLIMERYRDPKLLLDDLKQAPAEKVVNLIYPKDNLRHKNIPLPDFQQIHENMVQMGKNTDLGFLWIEYKKKNPNGYQLSQFYKLYRNFLVNTYGSAKVSMPVERIPDENYTLCDYKYFLKAPDNYHLEYDAHYYSILYTQRGKPAILKATMTEIKICDKYNCLICRHPRSYKEFPLYITDDSHTPQEHLYKEMNAHDGTYLLSAVSVYGDSMITLIDRTLRSQKHEEQTYNSCAGILHSCKDVPHRLVQEAADKCVEVNACKYSYFKKVLGMVQNNHSVNHTAASGKIPSHANIRGKDA